MPDNFDVPDLDAMEEFHDDLDDVSSDVILGKSFDEDLEQLNLT